MEINEFSKIVEAVTKLCETKLSEQVQNAIKKIHVPEDPYQSASQKNIAPAFAKAQAEFRHASKNRQGQYKKYPDLESVFDAVRKPLAKNGLSFYQFTKLTSGGQVCLHSRLLHASGEWIETRAWVIPQKNTEQQFGSAMTYNRRYSAYSLLGIAETDDEYDDDGQAASDEAEKRMEKGISSDYTPPKTGSYDPITSAQLEELEYELENYPDLAELILQKMQMRCLADMPKAEYRKAINKIRLIKKSRNEGE